MASRDLAFSVIPNADNTLRTPATLATTTSHVGSSDAHPEWLADTALLSGIPILLPTHAGFKESIKTWSLHHQPSTNNADDSDKRHAVFRPRTTEDIARVVRWAGFKIITRSSGIGGASGRGGVCLDMGAFDQVQLDEANRVIAIGPGQTWADVNAKLKDTGYSALGSRTPYVGVGGYLLCGGLSWLSHEHGITNDPHDLLGATVVLPGGHILHANNNENVTDEERDIMWALRGGNGNFGAVTEFIVRALPAPKSVYAGYVFYTFEQSTALSQRFAHFLTVNPLPTSALIMMIMDFGRAVNSTEFTPMIGILLYDSLGETHARTKTSADGGFSWLWDVPGGPKAEMLHEGTYEDAVNTQAASGALFGLTSCHMDTFTPWHGEIDVGFLKRCLDWYKATTEGCPEIAASTFIFVAPLHPRCFEHGVRDEDTAWPHGKGCDVVQLGCAWMGDRQDITYAKRMDKACEDAIKRACSEIPVSKRPSYPNYGNAAAGNTLLDVYGANLSRLHDIKKKYDPQGLFLSAGLGIFAA